MLKILVNREHFLNKTTLNGGGGEREGRRGDLKKEQKRRTLLQVQNILSKIVDNANVYISIYLHVKQGL